MSSRLTTDALSLQEPEETVERIVRFLRNHVERIGAKNLIVGMSGGLDSSVASVLCSMAVGGESTLGFSLPEVETKSDANLRDAQEISEKYGIVWKSLDITQLIQDTVLLGGRDNKDNVALGNVKARLRATILYYYANVKKGLVVGTGDKSESMLGYFTKYGDGACDVQPLGDLYKTMVRDLAKHIKLPPRVYSKPSSPELWPGQTAEEDLGLPYEKLDTILWALERWLSPTDISRDLNIPLFTVERIRRRWLAAEHKRRPPLVLKLGYRTSGQDLRLPYTLSK